VSDLSGGERRRVTIARALAQDTAILLLDEPAAFLDVRHALTLFEIVRREISERNLACLAVVHDLSQAARFADRVVLLADGKIAAQGSIEEAMTANVLQRVFGVPVRVGRDESTGLQYFLPGA
nr:ABC transporter ATP-binding protein [Polyangiaceae bacterium]